MRFFTTTYTGLEDIAASEIRHLLGLDSEIDVAKVFFDGSLEDCIKPPMQGRLLIGFLSSSYVIKLMI